MDLRENTVKLYAEMKMSQINALFQNEDMAERLKQLKGREDKRIKETLAKIWEEEKVLQVPETLITEELFDEVLTLELKIRAVSKAVPDVFAGMSIQSAIQMALNDKLLSEVLELIYKESIKTIHRYYAFREFYEALQKNGGV